MNETIHAHGLYLWDSVNRKIMEASLHHEPHTLPWYIILLLALYVGLVLFTMYLICTSPSCHKVKEEK